MLTDEQLKKAARYLCEKYHLDPERFDPLTLDGPGGKTYEETFADEIKEHELLHEAIAKAKHCVCGETQVVLDSGSL